MYLYIVFQLMAMSLATAWKQSMGRFERSQAVRYFKHACTGLRHLHRCAIVHRDLSMGNMLVDEAGVLEIADLGCSFSAEDVVRLSATHEHESEDIRAPEL